MRLTDFNEDNFNRDLQNNLSEKSIEECASSEIIFLDALNK